MSESAIAFVMQLASLSSALTEILNEHMKENFGEVLPHVFLGDVTRHLILLAQAPASDSTFAARRELRTVLDSFEHSYETGTREVQELIAASFLENLPVLEETGSKIRSMLGPKLSGQLRKMT